MNKCVAKFLNRIHDQLGAVDVVHRVHIVFNCQHILSTMDIGQRRNNEELVTMLRHIAKSFIDRVKLDPSFIVAGLLSLSCRKSKLCPKDGKDDKEDKDMANSDDHLVLLSGQRDADLGMLIDHAINQQDLKSVLTWLLETLNSQLNVFFAAQEAGHLMADFVIICDTDYHKQALMMMRQLLELLGLQLVNSKWTIPASIDLQTLESDIQLIAKLISRQTNQSQSIVEHEEVEPLADIAEQSSGVESDSDIATVRQNWEQLKQSNQFLMNRNTTTRMPLVIDSDDDDDQ